MSGDPRVGWRGHYGPDLYHSNHLAPMAGDSIENDIPDDFGCDPMMGGSCSHAFGWEYDGPGYFGNERSSWNRLSRIRSPLSSMRSPIASMATASIASAPTGNAYSPYSKKKKFGGDLSAPILSNWGRYPSRSPTTGVFAGDLSAPILSNWGRYPSRSPLTGVFAGDGDDDHTLTDIIQTVGSVAQATAAVANATRGPAPVQRINQDNNPTTSGQGGVIDAVNAVGRGTASNIAVTRDPSGAMMMPMDTITASRPHPNPHCQMPYEYIDGIWHTKRECLGPSPRRAQPLRPLPYFGPAYIPPPMYSPADVYGRPMPAYNQYASALAMNPYYRNPGY